MSAEMDQLFMDMAIAEAFKAEEAGEVPVGAVVVLDGSIIGRGFNRPISSHDPTAHAEILALREAAAAIGNYRLPDSTVYVTMEPCAMCAGAMVHARVARLVFGALDPKAGAAGSLFLIPADARLNHQIDIVPGVRADKCAELLRNFFDRRR